MKKLTLLISAIAISSSTFCQATTSYEPQNGLASATYRLKAKKQKTAAWICLGGGAAMITTAAIIGSTKAVEDVWGIYTFSAEPMHNYTGETVLLVLGSGAMLASIPLFVGAASNNHKARLLMTEQKTAIGLPIAVPKKIPSLTLSISL